jgi:hypothetical protein
MNMWQFVISGIRGLSLAFSRNGFVPIPIQPRNQEERLAQFRALLIPALRSVNSLTLRGTGGLGFLFPQSRFHDAESNLMFHFLTQLLPAPDVSLQRVALLDCWTHKYDVDQDQIWTDDEEEEIQRVIAHMETHITSWHFNGSPTLLRPIVSALALRPTTKVAGKGIEEFSYSVAPLAPCTVWNDISPVDSMEQTMFQTQLITNVLKANMKTLRQANFELLCFQELVTYLWHTRADLREELKFKFTRLNYYENIVPRYPGPLFMFSVPTYSRFLTGSKAGNFDNVARAIDDM